MAIYYTAKPASIAVLKANIGRVIVEILYQPGMDHPKLSRTQHLQEIIVRNQMTALDLLS